MATPLTVIFNAQNTLTGRISGIATSVANAQGPASYLAGGFDADIVTDMGISLANIKAVYVTSKSGYHAYWEGSTGKVFVTDGDGTQVVDTTNVDFQHELLIVHDVTN